MKTHLVILATTALALASIPGAGLALSGQSKTKDIEVAQASSASLREENIELRRALRRTEADLAETENLLRESLAAREALEAQFGKSQKRAAPASQDKIIQMRYTSALPGDIVECALTGETRIDGDWTPFGDLEFTLVRGEAKALQLYSQSRREGRQVFADLSADSHTVRICRQARNERCTSLTAKPGAMATGVQANISARKLIKGGNIQCRAAALK